MKSITKKAHIIELLRQSNGYLSGAEIASITGVSRVAVWKRINSLRKNGYHIESAPLKGYKLLNSPDLSIEEIKNTLSKEDVNFFSDLMFYETLPSTNITATELGLKGCPEGTVIIANEQTNGKGRLGRKWISPLGKNLYMSIILTPPISPRDATILTIMSAVACCIALNRVLPIPVSIKWPNDLIVDDKKIGGILTEIKADIDKISLAVIGIGININLELGDIPEDIKHIATSMKILTGEQSCRTTVAIEILKEVQKWYDTLLKSGKEELLFQWRQLTSTIGKKVKVNMGNDILKGIAEAIDNEGLLILRLQDNSTFRVNAGDITMLRAEES